MHENRLNMRLLRYWETLKKDKPLPPIQKFNYIHVEDLWPYCAIIEVNTRQSTKQVYYHYGYVGRGLIVVLGEDLTGFTVHPRMRGLPGMTIISKLDEVCAAKAPILDDNHFHNSLGKLIKYRGCFLPFGDDTSGVTSVLVGISHRTF